MSIELTSDEYLGEREGLKDHSPSLEEGEYFLVIDSKYIFIYCYHGSYDSLHFTCRFLNDARDLCARLNIEGCLI